MDTTTEIPAWLLPIDEGLPRYPSTKLEREIEQLVFEALFERVLDQLVEGKAVKNFVESDPRQVSFGRFMRWVRKDPNRKSRYDEAQLIGTEVLAEEMKEIADGTDSPEDVNRSKLRVDTRWRLMQANNREKYGAEKTTVSSPFANGVTIVIGDVKPAHPQLVEGITIDG